MNIRLMIPALLAAVTFSASAFARGGDHDGRGWNDHRDNHWQHQRHDDWRHDHRHNHWRHDRRPPPYAYGYGYPPPPRYYEQPVVRVPVPHLPPPPHEVLRDIFRGHR